jgi:hypothetical protein
VVDGAGLDGPGVRRFDDGHRACCFGDTAGPGWLAVT